MTEERTIRSKGARPSVVRALRLEVRSGLDRGKTLEPTAPGPVSVGVAADNALVLTDRTVSRYHVEIEAREDGLYVTDLGSLNGTFVGETKIERARVAAGTDLRVGDTILRLAEVGALPEPQRASAVATIPGMVAVSAPMLAVAASVTRLATSNVSVLIQGETGTGKEVVARALHELSPRRREPFVVVDCGSMPATLIASELFGHERGAFTGADRTHEGAFERAHKGTIFLDEIGELPIQVQPALLGALERRSFRRVGGARDIEVDVRVVAATHRDVRSEVNVDGFRADLYYRIAVARVVIPPLRERPDDIEALTRHFVTEMTGTSTLPFGPETMNALRAHRWSGNVRELRNVVEAAVAMGEVKLDKTKPGIAGTPATAAAAAGSQQLQPYKEARARVLGEFEQQYLSALIAQSGGNASEAARFAGMDRQYLLGLLRRHGLR